jgi:hypothetical protein
MEFILSRWYIWGMKTSSQAFQVRRRFTGSALLGFPISSILPALRGQ